VKHYEFEISKYVEGELPLDKREEMLSHLSKCKKCTKTLNEYKKLKNDLTDFYEALPSFKNNNFVISNKNHRHFKFVWKIQYAIPLLGAALIVLILLFLPRENAFLHKPVIDSSVSVNRNTKELNQAEKIPILSLSNYESEPSINYSDDIKTFNKVIDKAIEEQERGFVSSHLLSAGYHLTKKEFNEGINSFLYKHDLKE